MPKRAFRTPDFKTYLKDFEHFQTRTNYKGTFPVLKIENPEKVVFGFVFGNFTQKNFFEPSCRGRVRIPKNRSNATASYC